jgi:hypothetical protein
VKSGLLNNKDRIPQKKQKPLLCCCGATTQKRLEETNSRLGLAVFLDIQLRLIDGFDDNRAFRPGHESPPSMQNVILVLTCTGDPNDAILALNRHSILTVIQIQ